MTDMDSILGEGHPHTCRWSAENEHRRRGPGRLIALVILALLGAGTYYGVTTGIDKIRDQFSTAEDYPGPGRASHLSGPVW